MTSSTLQRLTEAMQCQQAGQLIEAERLCGEVLGEEPNNLDALQLMAVGKFLGARHDEALHVLEKALALNANSVEFHVLAGHSLRALGRIAEAAQHYAQASQINPGMAEIRVMLGWSLRVLGRPDEAMAQYRAALALNPNFAEAHNNMGVLYHDRGELEPAVACYRAAISAQTNHIDARRNLAAALRAQGRTEEGLAEFEAIRALKPDDAYAALMIMHTARELCRWDAYDAMAAQARALAETQGGKFSPLLLMGWPVAPELLLKTAKAYAATFKPPQPLPPATPKTASKLRIGYFSPDFRDHVIAAVIPEVLENHDRAAFEVVAYSYGPDDGGPQRKRIATACDAFVDIRALSDDDAARKMRDDGIDILVDLNGYTGNIRHHVPARRPAPVQINWLGYPGTTGSAAIDYLVADNFTIPPGAEVNYSEKIIRLPGSCQPHDAKRIIGQPKSRGFYGLPEGSFVFCSFNHPQKITPDIFRTWMAILTAVPGSVLWLRADRDGAVINLRKEAAALGVSDRRLIFAPRTAVQADHLARYRLADLALDTFPYTSHTTANDALWLGCPLVTLVGDTFQGRVAGGILQALGLSELATDSLAAYRDTAVRLATQAQELAAVKAKLAAALNITGHFDTARFTRDLESGYREAWKLHVAGESPRHIAVAGPR